jgi:hypothetical protein
MDGKLACAIGTAAVFHCGGVKMNFGEKNVGDGDKAVRAVVAIALIVSVAGGYVGAPLSYAAILLALVMAATAALGTCGLYSLVGISTCAVKQKKK